MKKITIISLAVMLGAMNLFAQTDEVKYRRSSLSMVLIESESFPNKEAVMNSWNNYPFPDKYNEHNVDLKSININAIKLTDQDLLEAGYLNDTIEGLLKITKAETEYNSLISSQLTKGAAKPLKYLNEEKTSAVKLPSEKQEYQIKINKVINEKGLAKQMIATWFNRSSDGNFDMSIVQERGFYNASEMEAGIASGQVKGLNSLGDAGEELIKNSFTTFTKLKFVENEPVAAAIRDAAKAKIAEEMVGKPQMLIDRANKAADKVYEKTKEGYSVWSKTWLYRLVWNDSIANVFYSDLWSNTKAFDKTDIFKLKFVGVQYNQSLVTFKIGETRTEEQIIDLAVVRNVDNAFAKLQKKNDVFKPAIPVTSTDGKQIMAKIGLKEGISPGDKFQVLEMIWDEEAGKTTWEKVKKCKVSKKAPIWDNRYTVGEDVEVQKDDEGNPVTATTFKGSKKIQVGMLLKQLK